MISKEELEEMYLDKGMTQKEIANKFNVTRPTIIYWMKKYGIKSKFDCINEKLNKITLEKMYLEKGMPQDEIAKKLNVSPSAVWRRIKEYKIPTRNNKNDKQFIEEVKKLTDREYTPLDKYKNNKTKIRFKHISCDSIFVTTPDSFLNRGVRCPRCERYGNKEKFTKKLNKKFNKEFEVLGEYIDSRIKIKIKHTKCSYVFKTTPNNILNSKIGCPKCAKKIRYINSSKSLTRTTKWFKNKVKEMHNTEYSVLGKYTHSKNKIKMKHNECGYIFNMTPNSILRGQCCPNCNRPDLNKRTTKDFEEEIHNLVGSSYQVLGKYKNNKAKIKIKHIDCGHKWYVRPSDFLQGSRCPNCYNSKGELIVKKYLKAGNINFAEQMTMDGCARKQLLPFDFAILNHEGKIQMLIEYDGKQHYEIVEYFGGQEGFEYRKQNDQIKNKYCKENNIPLLRIPYWEKDNIEGILERELIKHGLIKNNQYEPVACFN